MHLTPRALQLAHAVSYLCFGITGLTESWDLGPARFRVQDVHRIGILDLRFLNCDRHGGNILVEKDQGGEYRLHPIDHSYCFPLSLGDLEFEWAGWPQSKVWGEAGE